MFFIVFITIGVVAFLYFMSSSRESIKGKLASVKHDIKVSLPAMFSNAEDILYTLTDKVALFEQSSKVAVLTGGNRGIGIHVLKKLLECKFTVVLGVRSPETSRKAVESFIEGELTKGKVFYEKCDTGELESVRDFAKKVQTRFSAIHLLVNNAGILFVPYQKTKDGFESQMAVNYLGHFLLTHLLMPQLIAGSNAADTNSRIVNVSSCANEAGEIDYEDFNNEKSYHEGLAYCNSKLAQILFTNQINKIFQEKKLKIQAHSAHPGIVDTEIYQHSIWGSLTLVRRLIFKSPERGSRAIVYASISPDLEGNGGTYISNCRVSKANKLADDEIECKKFFDFTCKKLKIGEFF